jgi:hypothetical protein
MYLLLKTYPSVLTREVILSRERYYGHILKMLKQPLVNPSQLIEERLKVTTCGDTMLILDRKAVWIPN